MDTVTNSTPSAITALQALTNPTNSASATTTSAADTQDRFLKLLVAQMKNQDPLNPLDNAQVTTQLAQISTVQGIEQLNTTMGKFADQSTKSKPADSVGLIGQSVLTAAAGFAWQADQTTPVRAGVDLAAAADQVKVEMLDAAGQVVDVRLFTHLSAGTTSFQWTGKDPQGAALPAGTYKMQVTALAAGQPVTATALLASQVVGVTQGTGTSNVLLAGGTSVSQDDIKGVFRP